MQWFTIAYTREGADRIHLETVEHPNEVEAWGYAVDMADTGCEVEIMPHYFCIPSYHGHSFRREVKDASARADAVNWHHKGLAARERLKQMFPAGAA